MYSRARAVNSYAGDAWIHDDRVNFYCGFVRKIIWIYIDLGLHIKGLSCLTDYQTVDAVYKVVRRRQGEELKFMLENGIDS